MVSIVEKHNENAVTIIVTKEFVESAVREFICRDRPELAIGWALNAKWNIADVVFAGTKTP